MLSAYATYQLKSWDAAKAFHNMGIGVRKTLDFSELGKKHFVLPTLGEQKNIVAFLDSKCSEIDAISADIQKEIETLEQYKRSLVFEAISMEKKQPIRHPIFGRKFLKAGNWLTLNISLRL